MYGQIRKQLTSEGKLNVDLRNRHGRRQNAMMGKTSFFFVFSVLSTMLYISPLRTVETAL